MWNRGGADSLRRGPRAWSDRPDPVEQRERWRAPYEHIWNGGTLTTAGNLVFPSAEEVGRWLRRTFSAKTTEGVWPAFAATLLRRERLRSSGPAVTKPAIAGEVWCERGDSTLQAEARSGDGRGLRPPLSKRPKGGWCGAGDSTRNAQSRVRRIATGDPDHLGRRSELLEQADEVCVLRDDDCPGRSAGHEDVCILRVAKAEIADWHALHAASCRQPWRQRRRELRVQPGGHAATMG